MFTLNGKYGEAKIFTDLVEESAISQVINLLNQPYAENANVRLMPDIHAGAGCTIGTTMKIRDKICPNLVGVDLNCGMKVINLGNVDINLKQLDEICHNTPNGMEVWNEEKEEFPLMSELSCFKKLRAIDRLKCSLGTLGGGNHFIELDIDDENNKYLVIHTGSRNLGKQVAEYHQNKAIEENSGKNTLNSLKKSLIAQYINEGKQKEIQSALKELEINFRKNNPKIPDELTYVSGENLKNYLHDVAICQAFAHRNRELIAKTILDGLNINKIEYEFETVHNYIDLDNMILRKGAVSAQKDEMLIIPMNMRDGSLICKGKGNVDWNCSAPHGAGRLMSRSKAKENISLKEFEESMTNIYSTSVNQSTIDESPMAYKPMESIVSNIGETVDIIRIIKPIYNFKSSN